VKQMTNTSLDVSLLFSPEKTPEALAQAFYEMVAAQYFQLQYASIKTWPYTIYNALVYTFNHLMVFIADFMSYLSLNKVNQELKKSIKQLSLNDQISLFKACQHLDSEMNTGLGLKTVKTFLNDYIDAAYEVPSPFF
jgi:hypothetical protein